MWQKCQTDGKVDEPKNPSFMVLLLDLKLENVNGMFLYYLNTTVTEGIGEA